MRCQDFSVHEMLAQSTVLFDRCQFVGRAESERARCAPGKNSGDCRSWDGWILRWDLKVFFRPSNAFVLLFISQTNERLKRRRVQFAEDATEVQQRSRKIEGDDSRN